MSHIQGCPKVSARLRELAPSIVVSSRNLAATFLDIPVTRTACMLCGEHQAGITLSVNKSFPSLPCSNPTNRDLLHSLRKSSVSSSPPPPAASGCSVLRRSLGVRARAKMNPAPARFACLHRGCRPAPPGRFSVCAAAVSRPVSGAGGARRRSVHPCRRWCSLR